MQYIQSTLLMVNAGTAFYLKIVFSQLSFLLNLVQGLLDIKAKAEGRFTKILEVFNPLETLKEVADVFFF